MKKSQLRQRSEKNKGWQSKKINQLTRKLKKESSQIKIKVKM